MTLLRTTKVVTAFSDGCKQAPRRSGTSMGTQHLHSSILLGYDQYAGNLRKIRNYLTDGIRVGPKGKLIKSPLKAGATNFEKLGWDPSWVDHFLRDHLHIVRLSLEFTEIDLWWLLLHKRRRRNITGHTFYYRIRTPESDEHIEARTSALASLGVDIQVVVSDSYEQGYRDLLPLIQRNVQRHPSLLTPQTRSTIAEECDQIRTRTPTE
jgi:hypothetical protein